ncbi:hypothetical protein B566_EDAN013042, partial [Ephemera danica]
MIYSECTIQVPRLSQLLSSLYKGKITTEHVQVLIRMMEKCLRNPSSCFCYGLNPQTVFQQMANVLKALVEPYGDLFINREELAPLLVFLSPENDLDLISTTLKIFSVLGTEKSECTKSSVPLESRNLELAHYIKNTCETLLFGKEQITLSTSLLKQIINFIQNNLPLSADSILTNYFLMAKEKLEGSANFSYSPYIALLGYLSPWLPLEHRNVLKSTISRKVVKDLLIKSSPTKENLEVTRLKCSTTNLSAEVFCKILGMKTIYRWLLSTQGEDLIVIGNTLRMLDAFLVHKGDLLDAGDLSDLERAALRLTAGRCILKICGSKNALKQLNPNLIHNLSQLMMDENAEVREKFGSKLYKDLCPRESTLSSLFLSFLALGILDPEEFLQQRAMQHIEQFCQSKRQEWDEQCLFWLIPLLANAPSQWILPRNDKDSMLDWPPNVLAQQRIRLAIWSIIAPMLPPQPKITIARIQHIVQKIKNSEDGMSLDCNSNV